MYQAVMEVAERKQVVQVALAAATPELDVMRAGPVDRPVAARRRAGPVPSLQRSPLRGRDRPRCSSDVHYYRVRLQDPGQSSIAGQALHGLARDRHPRLQLGGGCTQLALQALDRGVDVDVGPGAVAPRHGARLEGVVGHLGQGIRPTLPGSSRVIGA